MSRSGSRHERVSDSGLELNYGSDALLLTIRHYAACVDDRDTSLDRGRLFDDQRADRKPARRGRRNARRTSSATTSMPQARSVGDRLGAGGAEFAELAVAAGQRHRKRPAAGFVDRRRRVDPADAPRPIVSQRAELHLADVPRSGPLRSRMSQSRDVGVRGSGVRLSGSRCSEPEPSNSEP